MSPKKDKAQSKKAVEDETSTLTAVIERVVFHAQDTGFTVARIKLRGKSELETAVGKMASLNPGESVELTGKWINNKKFGKQFQVESYMPLKPGTLLGIEKYLGSGLIKGIGPVYAGKLVEKFGMETLDIIDNQPERIREVEGIGKRRAGMILEAWREQKNIRRVMVFLQGHGVGPIRAVKIFKTYGDQAVELIRDNPYRLADDIWGIGFKIADGVAQKIGFALDSPHRARAAILHVLNDASGEGHCFLPWKDLQEICCEKMQVPPPVLEEAFNRLLLEERVISEGQAVYLKWLYFSEMQAAKNLAILSKAPPPRKLIDPDLAVDWVSGQIDMKLSPGQAEALKLALSGGVSIITGGPGVGKTTILKALVTILRRARWEVTLCAPTGRAAKRMTETVGLEAKTIHRLLKYKPGENKFEYDGSSRLNTDCVIVDEMSMVDIGLFNNLLTAIPPGAGLIMVGDVDQLPSVGAGMALRDLIDSGRIPTARLTEIFRQHENSLIIKNAHRVNRGEYPISPGEEAGALSDFYFVNCEDPAKIEEIIIKTVTGRIPARFGFDPIEDVQVISPMAKRGLGAQVLNDRLQEVLNPGPVELTSYGRAFKTGDKVMQIRNNYDKEVFNGDMGRIVSINGDMQFLQVNFDGSLVEYDFSELDEIVLAYACTVHKSQGSEFPAVVMPLYTGHFILLQRNLLYTALTRAKKLAVMVGSRKALGIAIGNDKIVKRHTRLKERIIQEFN